MSENQNVNQKEKKFSIIVTEHDSFDPLMESKCLTTMELADKVNQLLSPMFADYEGCFINPPDQNHGYVNVSVFFRATQKTPGEGQIKNLESIIPTNSKDNIARNNRSSDSDIVNMVMNMNNRVRGRSFQLTQKTKEGLSEFIPLKEVKEDYWKNNVIEMTDPTPYGSMQYVIYVRVDGLDINRLLKKIYGGVEKDENGETRYIDYMVTLVRPIQSPVNPTPQNPWNFPTTPPPANVFMTIVSRLDNKNLDDLCRSLGVYNYSTGVNMVHVQ